MKLTVGIDLGTSNCAMAYVEPGAGANAPIKDVSLPQWVRPGEQASRALLPSAIYLPMTGELPGVDGHVVGELARWQGSRVPGRVITSAKSWLCHTGVDRQAPILPWGAAADVPRLSPVAAQAELLSTMRAAWNLQHPEAPLEQQEVVLTVPASFDEAARALTLQAARDAGLNLDRLMLLEEPQAAFYDFTARHRSELAKALASVRLVLVVDVGGGTTDFSLVQVAMLPEGPSLKRLAVGDHLLLGGDNMDGALARFVESNAKTRFTGAQWSQAIQASRAAKETLLGENPPERQPLAIAGSGSRLLGSTISSELTRDDVERLIVEGFFPAAVDGPQPPRAPTGVVELGLPFATDPAITRHLVAFLTAHAEAGRTALAQTEPGLPRPDAILLNGGVFNSPRLTRALVDAASSLWPGSPKISLLPHDSLDLAVARGAAYSGLARRALGKRIGGGAPRAYYAVVASEARERQGVCLIPRGLEEGESVELTQRPFTLTLGKPVQFQLVSTTADRLDKPGDLVAVEGDQFKPLPPIHAVLNAASARADSGSTPANNLPAHPERSHEVAKSKGVATAQTDRTRQVHLGATLTEVGTVAVSAIADDQRWRLEFDVRGSARADQQPVVVESMPARFAEAIDLVDRVYGTRPLPVEPKDIKNLVRALEKVLGPRDTWRLPVLRELWTSLFAGASKRRRSPDHERVLFHLMGYALRPGFGYPLDGWRCEQTFTLFPQLVQHHAEQAIWAEFFICWRRIAPGLSATAQQQLFDYLEPHLARRVPPNAEQKTKLKGVQPQALDEMIRCAASLELVAPDQKARLGGWIVERLHTGDVAGGPWTWALGRLGARVPINSASHRVLDADVASEWIALLATSKDDAAPFAIAQLARRTGDRARDVSDETRAQALTALTAARAPESWRQMVAEVVALSTADQARALGDTLPLGLAL